MVYQSQIMSPRIFIIILNYFETPQSPHCNSMNYFLIQNVKLMVKKGQSLKLFSWGLFGTRLYTRTLKT